MTHMDTQRVNEAVGSELRARRAKLGLRREDVALKSGISTRTLARFESGERSVDMNQLVALCEALLIAPDAFMRQALGDAGEHRVPR